MPKINSLEVVHQDTNQDSYQNLHDILVALNKSLALEKEVVDTDARASIENLLEMYVNDKEAFLRSLTVLAAEFKASQAQYSEEIMLKASELEALARKITSLSAVVQDNNAAIYTEQGARVTADEALAYSIETVSATVGSKNRTYYQSTAPSTTLVNGDLWIDSDDDKLYRWDGSSWVDVQDNQIGVNTAAITNEATARVNGDSANATSINAVTARLDTGDFATVKTQSSTTATKVGNIEAKWGVTTNVNGQVAGIELLNGTNTSSSFTVAANKFIVKKPDGTDGIAWNGSTSRLDISGDVYANNFYGTGVIGTTNISSNSVSQSFFTYQNNYDVTLNFNVSGVSGESYNIYVSGNWVQSYTAWTQLYFDGNLVRQEVPSGGTTGILTWVVSATPGSHSVQLISYDSRNVNGTSLHVLVTKR